MSEIDTTAPESTDPRAGTATRRQVLVTTGVVVAAAAVTAACGSSGSSATAASTSSGPVGATLAEVPVGGGKVLADAKVVITQPVAGTVKAFSAVCTHQGCVVSDVTNGSINCACHGSAFSAADGSVLTGPARSPLAPVNVTVTGDQITVA